MTEPHVFVKARSDELAEVTARAELAVASAAASLSELVEAVEAALKKAQARESFAWLALRAPTPDPCRSCGRLVLAGRCCDKPDLPPYPPPVAELAQRLHDAEAGLAALRDAVRGHQDVAHLWHEEVADAATFAERMETLIDADARLLAALADTAAAAEAYTRRVEDETAAMYRESARLAEVERERLTVCRRCGDTVTPGTMNARGVLHTADGVECGTCVDDGGYERRVRAEALRAAASTCHACGGDGREIERGPR